MDRSRSIPGYYPEPYLQYPKSTSQVYAVQGTGNAVPRPSGTTMDYMRTGQGAGEGTRRIEYYVEDLPTAATGGARHPAAAGEYYYAHGPPAAPAVARAVPSATYYTQEPQTAPASGCKSCGSTPKVQYTYIQGTPVTQDATPVVTRQVLPPPASNPPPAAAGYYYVQESGPTRAATTTTSVDLYPPPPSPQRPYPDSSGNQRIISYERYVVPASSTFTYDPTSAAPQEYYRPSLPPAGATQQPSSYRYDGDGYPGHVTGSLQPIQQDVAERFGAMRIGGVGGASDVIYLPRSSSSSDVVYKDSRMWRPRK